MDSMVEYNEDIVNISNTGVLSSLQAPMPLGHIALSRKSSSSTVSLKMSWTVILLLSLRVTTRFFHSRDLEWW